MSHSSSRTQHSDGAMRLVRMLLPCLVLAAACRAGAGGPAGPPGADPSAVGPRTEAAAPEGYAGARYVSAAKGSDSQGDGSRARPWATVRHALSRTAAAPDRREAIFVAEGTYPEAGLRLKPHVDLYGGFNLPDWQRDIVRFRSVLDGRGRDRVLYGADHARVDGFVLRGGRSRGPGGAVLCDRTSPALTNDTFVENGTLVPSDYLRNVLHQVGSDGGAVACLNYASPRIERCLFLGNTTEVGGGAAIGLRSHSVRPREEIPPPVIRGCLFLNNRAGVGDTDPDKKKRGRSSNGAAISLSNYLADIENNLFIGNRAGGNSDAGGIYCEYEASARISRNTFLDNGAEDDGGAIYSMKLSEPLIEENLFAGNVGGGTIRLSKQGRGRIERNLVVANPGGGVASGDSWMFLQGNRILDNGGIGVLVSNRAAPYMKPSLLRGNVVRGHMGVQITVEGDEPTVEENNVAGGFRGTGNRDVDPRLDTARHSGTAEGIRFDPLIGLTTLRASGRIPADRLPGRVLHVGEKWGVVRSARDGELVAWGDLRPMAGTAAPWEILGTYLPLP